MSAAVAVGAKLGQAKRRKDEAHQAQRPSHASSAQDHFTAAPVRTATFAYSLPAASAVATERAAVLYAVA